MEEEGGLEVVVVEEVEGGFEVVVEEEEGGFEEGGTLRLEGIGVDWIGGVDGDGWMEVDGLRVGSSARYVAALVLGRGSFFAGVFSL